MMAALETADGLDYLLAVVKQLLAEGLTTEVLLDDLSWTSSTSNGLNWAGRTHPPTGDNGFVRFRNRLLRGRMGGRHTGRWPTVPRWGVRADHAVTDR